MEDTFPNEDEIRLCRMQTLCGVWEMLLASKVIDGTQVKLAPHLANEVVEHYMDDLRIIKVRYKIPNLIQLHKVAGLMASSIMRFRPVVPIVPEVTGNAFYANEYLAIILGLSICGEYAEKESQRKLSEEPWFEEWFSNFKFLLHRRNYTAESLVFIFQTLVHLRFPDNLDTMSA